MNPILKRYADLLVHYCLEIRKGDKLLVRSTTLAEPLVREVYRAALEAGAVVATDLEFREQNRLFLTYAKEEQLAFVSPLFRVAMETFDAYLYIRAPYNLREEQSIAPDQRKARQKVLKPYLQQYFQRTATRELKRNICQFPTAASAQEAGMSLEEYEQFVFQACKLFENDPVESWLNVRTQQQQIVDLLNSRRSIRYYGEGIDIRFSTLGRTWINSDGQTNMPSGEVFTSPVEDSVEGVVRFNYPAVYMDTEVEDVTLWVKNGLVEKWEARRGKEFLDRIFEMEGARRFGEAAIGTNYDINRFTKNILFDEKIGGTIHLALGQSYLQAGGQNQSPVHWDMIASMINGGVIYADDEKIYENGKFLFLD